MPNQDELDCYIPDHAGELDFYGRKTRKFPIYNTKSHHRLAIARLAAAAIERILEAVWTI
ncbi:MAG: hypothetical protein LBT90_00665 [Holosporaceae bacterium]|jgi:hypothetical protein|nr:hypothetical protein [Holosporaceae bacterium]